MKGLTLNQKEQAPLQLLNRMLEGEMNVSEAAGPMGLSERHSWPRFGIGVSKGGSSCPGPWEPGSRAEPHDQR